MSIGMTYDQYWYGDVRMVRAFVEAEKLRQKRIDEEAWLHGAYILRALDATVGNMFREKGQRPAEYPSKPMTYREEDYKSAEKTVEQEQQEAVWANVYMDNFVRWGKDWGKKVNS